MKKAILTTVALLVPVLFLTGGTLVDQGAPGRQGPWPVYIQLLPDGGGGLPDSGSGGGTDPYWVDAGTTNSQSKILSTANYVTVPGYFGGVGGVGGFGFDDGGPNNLGGIFITESQIGEMVLTSHVDTSNWLNGTFFKIGNSPTTASSAYNDIGGGQWNIRSDGKAFFVGSDMGSHQINNVLAGTASTDAVNVSQLNSALLWADGGAGAISPSPGSAVVIRNNFNIGSNSQTLMLDTQAAVVGEPSLDIRTTYPDGGCVWIEPFSYINTGGTVEFNSIACDGSTVQTEGNYNPLSGAFSFTTVDTPNYMATDSLQSHSFGEPMMGYDSSDNKTIVRAFHNDATTPAILIQDTYPSATGGCGLYQSVNGGPAINWSCAGWSFVDGGEAVAAQYQLPIASKNGSALSSPILIESFSCTAPASGRCDGGFSPAFSADPTCQVSLTGTASFINGGVQISHSTSQWDTEAQSGNTMDITCIGH